MTFLDTSALVGALLEKHPQHAPCRRAVEQTPDAISDTHALAETFATLTGFYKVPTAAAAELTLGLRTLVRIEALSMEDYETAVAEARQRGIMGGGIYDSLHATFARRQGAARIITLNPSHFSHCAPELQVLSP